MSEMTGGSGNSERQVESAQRFRDLHTAPELLLLPNAWDAGSAVIFERAGFPAIGTTSAGIAYSLGRPDGERLSLDDLLAVQEHIARRISVPLSVDVETGYAEDPAAVAANVDRVITAGAVGINIEDGRTSEAPVLADLDRHCAIIRTLAALRRSTGIPFVINARTDSYWLGLGDERERLERSIARGNAYLEAGADCVFVPGRLARDTIATLVGELAGPLNVIAAPSCPPPAELEEMRVARLSLGSGPARAAYGLIRKIAAEVSGGSLDGLEGLDLSYAQANRIFS